MKQMALAALAVVVFAGCSKKAEPAPAAVPPEAGNAAPAAAETAHARPVSISSPTDTSAALSAANAALKSREYEQAARNLLAVQAQKNLSDQQAAAAKEQMNQLQRSLAGAVASGDPKAKAAAELLRASATY